MPTSIADVARRAGVSQGTVSHVLNGNPRARIALKTQERIRQAAADLGYQPNYMARSLGRRRTDTLGLMIQGLQNPFYVQILESVERIALEAGYQVLVDAAAWMPRSDAQQAKLRCWPMDGALIWAQPVQTVQDYFGVQYGAPDQFPVVYLGGQPRIDDREAVTFDVYGGACAAMTHLVERGYRKIAYVFPHDWVLRQPDEPRRRAYREVCEASGIAPQLILMEQAEETREAGLVMGLTLASMPEEIRPRAILCFNDVIAQGVLFGLRRAGLRVPEDIAVVGFDGLQESQYLDVPLTTVMLPADQMCREALRVLVERIRDGQDALLQQVVIPARLIIGGTT